MPDLDTAQCRLSAMLLLTTMFFVVEIVVGYITNSMALIADSFHMFSDAIALVIAFVSVRMSPKKWSKNTFGWARAEILGALINAVFLCALCVSILIESIKRFVKPDVIHDPFLLLIVGGLGLFINLIGLVLFKDHHHHHHHGHSHHHHHHHHDHSHMEEKFLVAKSDENLTPRLSAGHESPKKKYGLLTKHRNHSSSLEDFFPETANHSHTSSPNQHKASGDNDFNRTSTPLNSDKTNDYRKQSSSEAKTSHRSDDNVIMTPTCQSKHDDEHRVDVHCSNGHHDNHSDKGEKHRHTSTQMNMHGVFLHVMADALGSVIVMISALVVLYTDWSIRLYIDPILSVFMVCLILKSTWPLLTESAMILLQTVPTHIEVDSLRKRLTQEIPGVLAVHEFHVWQLAGDRIIASAHIRCHNLQDYMRIAERVKEFFHNEGIHSTTIQPEFIDFENEVYEDENCVLNCPPTQRPHCAPQTCCGNQRLSAISVDGGGDPSENTSGVLLRRTQTCRSGSTGDADTNRSSNKGEPVSARSDDLQVSATSV